jgi:hypothetical protein
MAKAMLILEMPESCMLCTLTCHGMCFAINKDILDYFEKRHPDCPLRPVEDEKASNEKNVYKCRNCGTVVGSDETVNGWHRCSSKISGATDLIR